MPRQVQWYKSAIYIAGVQFPVYPGAMLSADDNITAPQVICNWGQQNFQRGFVNPSITVSFCVRDVAGVANGSVLTDLFLNLQLARTPDYAHDAYCVDALVGGDGLGPSGAITPGSSNTYQAGIFFWNGFDGVFLTYAKMDSLMISSAKGSDLNMQARFSGAQILGSGFTSFDVVGTTPFTSIPTSIASTGACVQWNNANVLRFESCTFSGTLSDGTSIAGKPFSFSVNMMNQLSPNEGMNGTRFPTEQNAGTLASTASILLQANDGEPQDGSAITLTVASNAWDYQSESTSWVQGPSVARNPGHVATFIINNPVYTSRKNRGVTRQRNMRSWSSLNFWSQSGGVQLAPISGSSSF